MQLIVLRPAALGAESAPPRGMAETMAGTKGALVFSRAGDAWIMDTNGANQTQLTNMGTVTQVHLASGVVAFIAASQLYWIPLNGFTPLAPPALIPNTAGVLEFDLSPDASKIVLTFSANTTIYTINRDGSSLTPINSASMHQIYPAWARDGKIYMGQSVIGNAFSQTIYSLPEAGVNNPVQLTNYFSQFPIEGGPSGRVAFLWNFPVKKIRVMNTDGSGTVDVPGVDAGDGAPIGYDYDAEVIYYPRFGVIYRVNIDGSANTPLASGVYYGVDYGRVPLSDTTAPVVVPTVSGTSGQNGWYRSDVTVTWSVSDPETPIVSTTGCGTVTLTSETPGSAISCTATNAAGLSTTVSVTIKIDKTVPAITTARTPLANANGWNNTPVTATFSCTDSLSGVFYLAPTSILFSSDGAGQSGSASCTDLAGNSATATLGGINIDRTPPAIASSRTPLANANGWNNTPVTATFSCTDSLSGVFSLAPTSVLFSSDGAGQSGSASCTDLAGNSATATLGGINIDRTPPAVASSRTPLANANGWNNTPVTATFSCADSLSGVFSLAPTTVLFSAEGSGQSASASCTDYAGNTAVGSIANVNIDLTPPILTAVAVTPNPLVVNTPATLSATLSDGGGSGLASATYSVNGGPSTSVGAPGASLALAVGPFAAPGVYTVCLGAADLAGNAAPDECVLLPVYDPNGGFVTGGGWLNSPAGAYAANPLLTGKANFGFVSKYEPGATTPSGDTQFHFQAAGFRFKSTSYEWLVVAGAKAQYKGRGTVNGAGDFQFILTAIDGNLPGGGGLDRFRLKVWSAGGVIYDNNMGAADGADPSTAISGGSIVIHKP